MDNIVEVKEVKKYFSDGKKGLVKAVDGVNITINKGETLGLVGESGCGKSTMARLICGLEDVTSGDILFEDISIIKLPPAEMIKMRRNFQMIFQDPYSSLNPRMTVGDIIAEPMIVFMNKKLLKTNRSEIKEKTKDLLKTVGLSPNHINRYPHEFSGGQRQRIGVARALALKPKLILCDEPVSALDVSIQAQILNLLKELQEEFSLTYLFISHDLSVVKHISDRIAVMYLGRIIEIADYKEIYQNPLHPYTQALLSAIPIPDPDKEKQKKKIALKGDISSEDIKPGMCRFYNRCFKRKEECMQTDPLLKKVSNNHQAACILL